MGFINWVSMLFTASSQIAPRILRDSMLVYIFFVPANVHNFSDEAFTRNAIQHTILQLLMFLRYVSVLCL